MMTVTVITRRAALEWRHGALAAGRERAPAGRGARAVRHARVRAGDRGGDRPVGGADRAHLLPALQRQARGAVLRAGGVPAGVHRRSRGRAAGLVTVPGGGSVAPFGGLALPGRTPPVFPAAADGHRAEPGAAGTRAAQDGGPGHRGGRGAAGAGHQRARRHPGRGVRDHRIRHRVRAVDPGRRGTVAGRDRRRGAGRAAQPDRRAGRVTRQPGPAGLGVLSRGRRRACRRPARASCRTGSCGPG